MNHVNPKVSVIIPCYNYARYLPEAVESVAAQSYRDFEIIIINDGSTDDTENVARSLADKYPEMDIRLVSQENKGLPGARNSGIRAAKGEYIQPLDADDFLSDDYLELTVPVLDSDPDMSLVYTDYLLFGDISEKDRQYKVEQEYDFQRLLNINFIGVCAMFRKNAWEQVSGYKEFMRSGYEDWEFYITLGEAGFTGKFIDQKLYHYRKHSGAMLKNSNRRHAQLCHTIKMLHPMLYSPGIARINPELAKIWLQLKRLICDPVSHYLYCNLPKFHFLLKKVLCQK